MTIVSYLDLALALPVALALAVPEAATAPADEMRLTQAESIGLLPRAETIHVQIGQRRDRWERGDVIAAITAGRDRRLALSGRAAGFGLSFVRDSGESVLVQTEDAKVRVWLELQAKQAGE